LLSAQRYSTRGGSLAGWLALFVACIGAIILLGYGYGAPLFYSTQTAPASLTSATALIVLGVGLLATIGPSYMPLHLLYGPSARARLMRAFLPVTVVTVLTHGALYHFALQHLGLNQAVLSAVSTLVFAAVTTAVVFQVAGVIGGAMDRAEQERRRADEESISAQARLQHLLTSSPAVIYSCVASGDFPMTFISDNVRAFGHEPQEILGATHFWHTWIHPDDRPRVLAEIGHLFEHGRAMAEYRFPCKDGTYRWVLNEVRVVRDSFGRPMEIVGYLVDVTELKQLREALHDSEERYRHLFNSGYDAVFVHGLTPDGLPGKFIEVNDVSCQRLGYTREELLQMSPSNIDAPEMMIDTPARIRRLLKDKHLLFDGVHVAKDGTKIPVEVNANLFDLGGQPVVLSVARDVTERKRLEAQFLQAQKMETIGRLAGGVAHDFNNLLTAMKGYGTLARRALPDDDPIAADIDQFLKAAERASSLTQRLLAFSRRQIMALKVVDLNGLILDMDKMMRRLIREDIELIIRPDPFLGLVKVDPSQIEQALVNLIVNARDAMPHGGTLTIETANVSPDQMDADHDAGGPEGDSVMLAVHDTGTGMTDEVKAHLFEPFFTTKEVGKGTGLGLATVYGIAKQHGGNVWISSTPGKGTVVKVYLPRVYEEMDDSDYREEMARLIGGNETILVVEDEPQVRALSVRVLRELGYTVLEAADGNSALRLARKHRGEIHLLLTDVVMPGMSGKVLHDRLYEAQPNLKALFISGYTDDAILRHGVQHRGIAFLQKPFTGTGLATSVRAVLNH
jgi:PAS domain S-box-containing protein